MLQLGSLTLVLTLFLGCAQKQKRPTMERMPVNPAFIGDEDRAVTSTKVMGQELLRIYEAKEYSIAALPFSGAFIEASLRETGEKENWSPQRLARSTAQTKRLMSEQLLCFNVIIDSRELNTLRMDYWVYFLALPGKEEIQLVLFQDKNEKNAALFSNRPGSDSGNNYSTSGMVCTQRSKNISFSLPMKLRFKSLQRPNMKPIELEWMSGSIVL